MTITHHRYPLNSTKHMQLTQLTDTQLIDQINILGEQILGTFREEQPFFDRLCTAYDAVQAELDSRGLW